jgi:hypothetical protein
MTKKNRVLMAAVAGGLMSGCLGPPPEGDEGGVPPEVETSQQALSTGVSVDSEVMDTSAQAAHCNLVVYQPYLVWNSSSYQGRAYAYVSCPSWVNDIELVVGLQDAFEITRVRRFSCSGTSTCVGAYNTYSPWGTWKTVASANVNRWSAYRESHWTTLSR